MIKNSKTVILKTDCLHSALNTSSVNLHIRNAVALHTNFKQKIVLVHLIYFMVIALERKHELSFYKNSIEDNLFGTQHLCNGVYYTSIFIPNLTLTCNQAIQFHLSANIYDFQHKYNVFTVLNIVK